MLNKLTKLIAGILLGVTLTSQVALAANTCNTYPITLAKASSQYLTRADTTYVSLTGTSTIEFWINVTSLPGSGVGTPVIFKGDYNTDNAYQIMYLNDAGTPKIHARIFASSGNSNIAGSKLTYTLTTGTWIHVAVVIRPQNPTASKFEFYINGSSQGNGTATLTGTVGSIYDNTRAFRIGQSDGVVPVTDYYLDAKVDEVRLWNVARTSSEISANYNTELTGSESNLQAYWQLNNALTDSTANGNTLTNVNSATFTTSVPFVGCSAPFNFGLWFMF